ncbi:cuticle protein 21 [Drosophila obscura]|uniref:cuticle protein 21 n=1 Tax=Drosophila obscura TaxID=7282 RepID=UPI000BA14AB3|nr:cuticle protein 21 [Drosophila obscura]
MFKFVLIASLLATVALSAPIDQDEEDRLALEREQNENAQYSFNSNIDDQINDNQNTRTEERDGSTVRGSYSYQDGFVKRTVHYIADQNGYRVLKDEMEDIGDGPRFNPDGQANVQGSLIGQYSIKLDKSDADKHYKDIRA